jgi:hypothetical protein
MRGVWAWTLGKLSGAAVEGVEVPEMSTVERPLEDKSAENLSIAAGLSLGQKALEGLGTVDIKDFAVELLAIGEAVATG